MIRILALHADRMRRNGSNASQIVTALEELKSKTRVFAALDTLEYLQRGGRLSKAAAAVGTLANLKPIITVSEGGTVEVIQKCMGRNKTVSFLMNKLQELNIDTEFPLYSVYTYGTENSEFFEKKMTDAGYRIAERVQVGATIGCHIGPGVYGFIYVEK
jgi:DegV family protein with EDD domain